MKVGILGATPEALEMALTLFEKGAAPIVFGSQDEWAMELRHDSKLQWGLSWAEMTTSLGREWLGVTFDLNEHPTFETFTHHYFYPLYQKLSEIGLIRPHGVHQVSKRFLLPEQELQGRSRFYDLFRLVYKVNPHSMVEKAKLEQPEMYENMHPDMLASLQDVMEMYQDVDVVIDTIREKKFDLGVGSPAVGEFHLEHFHPNQKQDIAIVGSGAMAALSLLGQKKWLEGDPTRRVFLISSEERPFEKFLKESTSTVASELKDFLGLEETHNKHEFEVFLKAEQEWMNLDDYIRAKKPKPNQPIPRVVFFSAHIVSSVDLLIDKSKIFLTCEKIPYLSSLVQPENGELELKTIAVDEVLTKTGQGMGISKMGRLRVQYSWAGKDALNESGSHPETGIFSLVGTGVLDQDYFSQSQRRRDSIMNHLGRLFSPKT